MLFFLLMIGNISNPSLIVISNNIPALGRNQPIKLIPPISQESTSLRGLTLLREKLQRLRERQLTFSKDQAPLTGIVQVALI